MELSFNGFQDHRHKPLGHPSGIHGQKLPGTAPGRNSGSLYSEGICFSRVFEAFWPASGKGRLCLFRDCCQGAPEKSCASFRRLSPAFPRLFLSPGGLLRPSFPRGPPAGGIASPPAFPCPGFPGLQDSSGRTPPAFLRLFSACFLSQRTLICEARPAAGVFFLSKNPKKIKSRRKANAQLK